MVTQNDNVRTMRFMYEQGAEDLYRCQENGRVYVRQQCNEDYVRWLSTSKWVGGYEADCPLREGLIMNIVNSGRVVQYQEEIVTVPGYCWTVAAKKAPFFAEAVKATLNSYLCRLNYPKTYEQWKAWMMSHAYAEGYQGIEENWLFCMDNAHKRSKIRPVDILGKVYDITKEEHEHQCGIKWTCYELRDGFDCLGIIGYEF